MVVVDAEGTVTALNAAACRLLDLDAARGGPPPGGGAVRARAATEIVALVQRLLSGRVARQEREVVRARRAAATATWR